MDIYELYNLAYKLEKEGNFSKAFELYLKVLTEAGQLEDEEERQDFTALSIQGLLTCALSEPRLFGRPVPRPWRELIEELRRLRPDDEEIEELCAEAERKLGEVLSEGKVRLFPPPGYDPAKFSN